MNNQEKWIEAFFWFVTFVILFTLCILLFQPAKAGSMKINGEILSCSGFPVIMRRINGETPGANDNGVVIIDLKSLRKERAIVQKFVFYHECGHSFVGLSEYAADCWATKQGAKNKWLKIDDIPDICLSFDGPATSTHPSGSSRCANIYKCFSNERNKEANK